MGQFNTATTFRSHLDFPVSFRAAPTLTTDTASNFCAQHGGANPAISAIALVGYTDTSVHLESTVAGQTAGNCAMLTALSGNPWIAISAEL
jgi:hypothetical protein